jgi:uncharacterized protein (DUF169 family)
MLGDAVYVTEKSIGCVAAAISLGIVDATESVPLDGPRVYTEFMRKSSGRGSRFTPPSPSEFSDGTVYACKAEGREEYGLFGCEDSGRYKDRRTAIRAIRGMMSIQPPDVCGAFFFSPEAADPRIEPDVVILSLRPVELCRIVQGYQFLTGLRVTADIGGVRAGCSDLIVRPHRTGEMNFSPYCLGARLIARFEGDRMGLGFPYSLLEQVTRGVEQSRSGFPFPDYPGSRAYEDQSGIPAPSERTGKEPDEAPRGEEGRDEKEPE